MAKLYNSIQHGFHLARRLTWEYHIEAKPVTNKIKNNTDQLADWQKFKFNSLIILYRNCDDAMEFNYGVLPELPN